MKRCTAFLSYVSIAFVLACAFMLLAANPSFAETSGAQYSEESLSSDYECGHNWVTTNIQNVHHDATSEQVPVYREGYDFQQCFVCGKIFWNDDDLNSRQAAYRKWFNSEGYQYFDSEVIFGQTYYTQKDEYKDLIAQKENEIYGENYDSTLHNIAISDGETLYDHLEKGVMIQAPYNFMKGYYGHGDDYVEEWRNYFSSEEELLAAHETYKKEKSEGSEYTICPSGHWGQYTYEKELLRYDTVTQDAYDEMITTYECLICGDVKTETASKVAAADWSRLYGGTRFATAKAIAQTGWTQSDVVILASGANFPDALAASSLAGAKDAPILLTDSSNLSTEAKEEIQALGVRQVYIVGGNAAVSNDVVAQLEGMGCTVSRLFGDSRTATARAVAAEVLKGTHPDTCIIASGKGFADALSISPYAYKECAPIYLAEGDATLSQDTLQAIKSAGYTRVVIVGGTGSVSAKTESQIKDLGITGVIRLGGPTRYESSSLIAEWAQQQGMGVTNLAVACGFNFPDALAGSALCGKNNSVLLLVEDSNTSCITGFISQNVSSISQGYVFGGTSAVSNSSLSMLAGL